MNNDAKVQALLKTVEAKRAEISKVEKFAPETNMSLEMNGVRINLNTKTSVYELVCVAAYILREADFFDNAAKKMGVDLDFRIGGFSVPQWISDIRGRIQKVSVATKQKELAALEEKLKALMSLELKQEIQLAEIESLLK